ncbi:MAG: sensor signal transduction histidine kinase [Verrucomicrobiales bacterium]|nr:sensor signal transduction histidine kinase [Verrucomicrobiales bacterium]
MRQTAELENEVREREKVENIRLAAIVHSSSEAIVSSTEAGLITVWNPAAEKIFGYSADEAVGRHSSLMTPPHLLAEYREWVARVQQGASIVGQETIRQRKDGTLIDVLLSASPLLSSEGTLLGFMALFQDITERKKTARALQEKEERLSLAVDLARMGMWDLELPKGPFYASARCLEIFAVNPSHAVDYAKCWRQSLHPADRGRISAALAKALQEQSGYDVEYRIVWPDDSIHWVSAKGKILRDDKGKPCRLLGVATDITERKNAEEALRKTQEQLSQKNQELEEKVRERTARLQEALTDLEQFSYSIVHDLRAPLRTMSQFAHLVQAHLGEKLDPMSKEFLGNITAGASRADQLIEDVLAYSRIARGELKLSPVDLASVTRQVVQAYPNLQSSQADIEIQIPETFVWGNAAALTQCIANLLSNAVKFVAPGVRPHLRAWTEIQGGQTRFSVRDNGIGIDPVYLSRLWDVFERAATDEHYEGTGIGLSIVRKAVERMCGTVGVESEPGRGSTFWFQLRNAPPTQGG